MDGDTIKNPIVSNILCYVSTARNAMKYEDILRVCLTFYNSDDIIKGKDLLCELLGQKSVRRRNQDRLMQEIRDILDFLIRCDDEGISLPSFVADSYRGLPPSSGFEVVAQHMTALIDEISTLRNEIQHLKESRLADVVHRQSDNLLQEDVMVIKAELRKLNHKLLNEDVRRNSLVLQSIHRSSKNSEDIVSGIENENPVLSTPYVNSGCLSPNAPAASQDEWMNRLMFDEGGPPNAPSFSEVLNRSQPHCTSSAATNEEILSSGIGKGYHPIASSLVSKIRTRSESSVTVKDGQRMVGHVAASPSHDARRDVAGGAAGPSGDKNNGMKKHAEMDAEGFTLVQSKKHKHRAGSKNVIGSKATSSDSTLRSAVRMGDLYLGNCDPSVSVESLVKYISDEIKIDNVKCESLQSRYENSKSFKLTLNMHDRMKLLSPDVWPEGIICRKYFTPRNNKQ